MDARFYPPRGLDRGAPRETQLTGAGRALVVGIIVLFAAAPVAWYALTRQGAREREEQRLIGESPFTSDGVVTRLWRPSKESKQPKVAYTFVDTTGRTWSDEAKISRDQWTALRVGDPVRIRFVESNPGLNIPDGARTRVMPFFIPYLIAGVLLLGGAAATLPLRIERRLLAEGRAAPAVVKEHFIRRSQHGKHRYMRYEFELMNGATARGKSGTSSKPPAMGSTVWVLYDPERPTLNRPYPLSLVRLADPSNS